MFCEVGLSFGGPQTIVMVRCICSPRPSFTPVGALSLPPRMYAPVMYYPCQGVKFHFLNKKLF